MRPLLAIFLIAALAALAPLGALAQAREINYGGLTGGKKSAKADSSAKKNAAPTKKMKSK
jgi:hypothetical protein